MKKHEFTLIVADLIFWIRDQGWKPLLDYALRSDEEQMRMFRAGLSKCDGKSRISAHQYGKGPGFAVDIYIATEEVREDKTYLVIDKREPYVKAHEYWEKLGGKPMIEWDAGHFEV